MNQEKCIYFVPGYFVPGGWCRLASSAAGSYEKCQKLCERAEFHDESKPLGYVLMRRGNQPLRVFSYATDLRAHDLLLAAKICAFEPLDAEHEHIGEAEALQLEKAGIQIEYFPIVML